MFAGYLADEGAEYSNVTHVVDSGGLGINVCQDLEDLNTGCSSGQLGQSLLQKTRIRIRYPQSTRASHASERPGQQRRGDYLY